jgi:hypothetical protein
MVSLSHVNYTNDASRNAIAFNKNTFKDSLPRVFVYGLGLDLRYKYVLF